MSRRHSDASVYLPQGVVVNPCSIMYPAGWTLKRQYITTTSVWK